MTLLKFNENCYIFINKIHLVGWLVGYLFVSIYKKKTNFPRLLPCCGAIFVVVCLHLSVKLLCVTLVICFNAIKLSFFVVVFQVVVVVVV